MSGTIRSEGIQPLFDAHWGMERTLDFYREKFNRDSYDGKGSIVYQIVNPKSDDYVMSGLPSNAFAYNVPPYPMIYGMGSTFSDPEWMSHSYGPMVAIDVMAHEFSHLVIMRNGNNGLEYEGEPGALNESFADIMGITVKEYAKGENDWKIGSEIAIYSEAMRNMKEPQEGIALKCPDTYGGEYWVDPEDLNFDYGGVHINSGVQNLWYYLICEGGTGINDLEHAYSVTGIGIDDGVQIAYRNLMYYLTPEANYEDARNGAIQSAIDLYEQDSQAHRSVVDAWYAVGVGKSYAEETGWTDSYSPAQQATKIMRNGQLFIIRNGQTYLINGMEVR